MPKNIKKEDIEIIKTLQNNNPNIMNDLEDVYKMMYIEKTSLKKLKDDATIFIKKAVQR